MVFSELTNMYTRPLSLFLSFPPLSSFFLGEKLGALEGKLPSHPLHWMKPCMMYSHIHNYYHKFWYSKLTLLHACKE